MKWSPDGSTLLGGVGDGRVRLDGVVPEVMKDFHAGSWDWLGTSGNRIAGQGSPNTTERWSLWQYNRATKTLANFYPSNAASNFYSSGSERWLVYLASRPGVSYDAVQSWVDRVAFGMSPEGEELFTTSDRIGLIGRQVDGTEVSYPDVQICYQCQKQQGVLMWVDNLLRLHASGAPTPQGPRLGSLGAVFSPLLPDGRRFLAQWGNGLSALVTYPWVPQSVGPLMGYVLSQDGHDFNHDISVRTRDGMLVIGTGINQGETAQRVYELQLAEERFRCNGGPWQPLTLVDLDGHPPLYAPIIRPYRHFCWVGAYHATATVEGYGRVDTPGNCEILTRSPFTDMLTPKPTLAAMRVADTVPERWLRGIYAGFEGGNTAGADVWYPQVRAYAERRGVPVYLYWDGRTYPHEILSQYVPIGKNVIPVFSAYPWKVLGEMAWMPDVLDQHRLTARALRSVYARVGMARPMYTQSGNWPLDYILHMQEPLADLVRDEALYADLLFSRLRPSGIVTYPELLPVEIQLAAAPRGVEPSLREPEPKVPHSPESDMSLPKVGDRGWYRKANTTVAGMPATIVENQDKPYLSLKKDTNDQVVHFNQTSGEEDGDRPEATGTGEERISFVSPVAFVSRCGNMPMPDGPGAFFEWWPRL